MTKLGELVDMTVGYAFKSSEFSTSESGIRLLRGDNIAQGRLRWDAAKRFPAERLAEVERYQLRPGDIVIAMDRPWIAAGLKYSVVRDSDLPCLLVQRVARLRAKSGLVQGYLNAIIGSKAFTDYVVGVQTGSAVPHISGGQIADFHVPPLPPSDEQRSIAATLGVLDDKVQSNRRAIACLEALGAALLESALAVDRYGSPEYEAHRRMGDVAGILETGSRPKGGVRASEVGVISLGAESIQSAGVMSTTAFKRIPAEFAAAMRRGRLEDMDVLVYKDGGKPGNFIPHVSAFGQGFPDAVATINEHVYRVRAVDGITQGLLYWILRSPWMDQEMRKRGTGVAIPGLNSTNFRDLPWPVLDVQSIQQLNERLEPLLVRMLSLGAESRRLAALRDALLPELLSGRIRVPEAADVVQDVVDESEIA